MNKLDNYEIIEGEDTLEPKHVMDMPTGNFTVEILNEKFEINLEHFNINEDNLAEESCMQGQYMVYYGDIFAKARAVLATLEHARKVAYSDLYIKIKRELRDSKSQLFKDTGGKMTEPWVENFIISMPDYTKAVNDEYRSRVLAFRAESWWKAIQKKADIIIMLGYRANAEYKRS